MLSSSKRARFSRETKSDVGQPCHTYVPYSAFEIFLVVSRRTVSCKNVYCRYSGKYDFISLSLFSPLDCVCWCGMLANDLFVQDGRSHFPYTFKG